MKQTLLCWLTLLMVSCVHAESKDIESFTSGFEAKKGFFNLYYQAEKDKVFLEIPALDQAVIFQSSLPYGIGSNDIGLDRGQLGETRLVTFSRYGNKVLLKQLNTQYRAVTDNQAEQNSIDEAFADSVIAGFTVAAESNGKILIDYTDFLLSDIHNVSERLQATEQGNYKVDASRSAIYMPRSKSFPANTELEAVVTFTGSKAGQYVQQVVPEPSAITVHLHHSFIQLPDDGYQPRTFHPYSGYWALGYKDYAVPLDQSMDVRFIPRHRLQKKAPGAAVSEAIEPIIYYLDPGIPEPVVSALKEGASWWDQAFAAIGYKNAFQVKTLPQDADPMDVRYNVIQWVHRATRGWSYGSSVIDPRTGEIIKGHVTLGSLRVRQDLLIANALTSPFSKDNADTSTQQQMALNRIKQLSAHEVGHTLGIAHNFAASVNQRASVMDYPHPKFTVEDNRISLKAAYDDKIGSWDKQVIAYGYQDYRSEKDETEGLAKVLQQSRDKGLLFQSDPDARPMGGTNPAGHLWDNGDDAVSEFERLSNIRRIAIEQFGINSLPRNTPLSDLEERFVPLYLLHRYQLDAVAKLIGGVDYHYEMKGDYAQPKGTTTVDEKHQQQAINAMLQAMSAEYLSIPEELQKLITPKAYGYQRSRESFNGRTGLVFDATTAAESAADYVLKLLLHPQRLNRVVNQSSVNVNYIVNTLLDNSVKGDVKGNLQNRLNALVLDRLVQLLNNNNLAAEVKTQVQWQLMQLKKWLVKGKRSAQQQVMAQQLELYFHTGQWQGQIKVPALPPGSPI